MTRSTARTPIKTKIWIDANDLFMYARQYARPSGIQRLSGELYAALVAVAPSRVGFVIHGAAPGTFQIVPWSDVQQTYRSLTVSSQRTPRSPADCGPSASILKRSLGALRKWLRLGRPPAPALPAALDLRCQAQSGDILCSLGAPWWHDPDYAQRIDGVRRSVGMRFAFLVYDLIPLLCPEFYDADRAPHFAKVMRETLLLADLLLTISHHTSTDVLKWAAREGLEVKRRPTQIPVGAGFAAPTEARLPEGLRAGTFVLFVATIEIRKNHLQAFRVWQRLLQSLPREAVPTLVFAGTVGWMVSDLMRALVNTRHLAGKIVVLQDVDDAMLGALYRGCLFTIFPSYYEGWGLPVSDSLAFGKLCVASDRTSIPEAGGPFCVYIDPDNTTGAFAAIRNLIDNPDQLRLLEERIRREFVPPRWQDTATALLAVLDEGLRCDV